MIYLFYFTANLILADSRDFCAYEEYENATLTHVDAFYSKKTKEECERLCDNATSYHCRGYSLVNPARNIRWGNCFLHSEDTKVHGPKLLTSTDFGRYYEKARCLNGKYYVILVTSISGCKSSALHLTGTSNILKISRELCTLFFLRSQIPASLYIFR